MIEGSRLHHPWEFYVPVVKNFNTDSMVWHVIATKGRTINNLGGGVSGKSGKKTQLNSRLAREKNHHESSAEAPPRSLMVCP